jgi:hypothetical protein
VPLAKAYRSVLPYRKRGRYSGADYAEVVQGFGHTTEVALPTEAPQAGTTVAGVPWERSAAVDVACSAPYGAKAPESDLANLPMHDLVARAAATTAPFDAIAPASRLVQAPIRELPRHDEHLTLPSDAIAAHELVRGLPLHQAGAHQRVAEMDWGTLLAHARTASALWRGLVSRNAFIALPWSPLGRHNFDVRIDWPVEYYDDDPLVFPIQRVYVMIPSLTLVRLPERTPVRVFGADIAGDRDGWAWTFSAQIAFADRELVDPADAEDPIEIEIAINGHVWTFQVDGCDDNRRFGSKSATIRGRSRSAVLAKPTAPSRSYTETDELTAAQLAEQELDGTGWTLEWDAVDWLVPENTFSYADLAPIEAIARLAHAIGATLQSDPEDKTLRVLPGYAVSPWEWGAATPYAIVPANVLTTGDSQWRGGSNADGVYVYAENAAYGALVKITGTAGANALPQIVESLAISADPARERGRIELARAGRIKDVTRTIPLFPAPAEPGLVPIGSLLQVTDSDDEVWRGQVTAVRITASKNGQAATVRQILTLERQFR